MSVCVSVSVSVSVYVARKEGTHGVCVSSDVAELCLIDDVAESGCTCRSLRILMVVAVVCVCVCLLLLL